MFQYVDPGTTMSLMRKNISISWMVAVCPPRRATAIGPPTFLERNPSDDLETMPILCRADMTSPRAVPK